MSSTDGRRGIGGDCNAESTQYLKGADRSKKPLVRTSGLFVRIEYGVTVECLKCRHVGSLTPKALSRAGPPAQRAYCGIRRNVSGARHRCGSQSVLAARKAPPQRVS